MSEMQHIAAPNKSHGRKTLVLLLLIFAAPIVLSLLTWSYWRPSGFGNNGDLIQPPRLLQPMNLQTLDGQEFDLHALEGKWTLVYFDQGECTEACRKSLYTMRQIRLGQSKNAYRVRTMLIVQKPQQAAMDSVKSDYSGMIVLTGSPSQIEDVAEQFATDFGDAFSTSGRLYLIDPLNNLMMSFAPQLDPLDILKDLKRLLKVSQIG